MTGGIVAHCYEEDVAPQSAQRRTSCHFERSEKSHPLTQNQISRKACPEELRERLEMTIPVPSAFSALSAVNYAKQAI